MSPAGPPLRVQLTAGTAALLTIALLAFGALAYRVSGDAVVRSAEQRARVTAFTMAQRAAGALRNQLRILEAAAGDSAVIAALRARHATQEALAVLLRLPADSQTVALGLRDTEGRTVVSARGTLGPPLDPSPARADTSHIGRIAARNDTAYFELVAPVFAGTVLAGSLVRVRRLTTRLAAVRTVSDLLGRGGELLFGNADGSLWTDVARPITLTMLPERRYERAGQRYLADTASIEGTPFAFAVGFPEGATLATVRRLFWRFGLIGGAILVIGLGLAWWGAGHLTRPLARLATAADGMSAEHSGPSPGPAPVRNELQRLQGAFQALEARVRASHAELQERVRDLQSSEEQLRLVDRRKDVFLATLAHELRNPLAPIRNSTEVLKLKGQSYPELRPATDVIDRQVGQMTRLLDDLLDLARIANDRFELRPESVDCKDILTKAVETSQPLIDAGGHRLLLDLPPEPVTVHGDPVRLCQVFANLLNNAAKFSDGGGDIRVQLTTDGSSARVVVSDDGVGIAPEQLARIFEPFSDAPRAPASAPRQGLGIGLSLVRSIVTLHGGSVSVASPGPGLGSSVTVSLPLLPHPPTGVIQRPEAGAVPSAERRVLIADDVRDSTDSLAQWLQLQGHRVMTAYDGESAVAAAEQLRPEFVLLDLGMPRIDGYEACRRIRSTSWGQSTIIIALTGWGQAEDRRKTAEVGFDFHMIKPVDPASLVALLASSQDRTSGPFRPRSDA